MALAFLQFTTVTLYLFLLTREGGAEASMSLAN